MKQILAAIVLVSALSIIDCNSAFGAEILRREFQHLSGGPDNLNHVAIFLGIGNPVGEELAINYKLFEDRFLSTADVGTTLSATAGEPSFDRFFSHITNGVDQVFWTGAHWPSPPGDFNANAGGGPESVVLLGPDFETVAPDLNGYVVERISLRLDRLVLNDPSGATNFAIDASFTVTFEGHLIPEPSTATALSLGTFLGLLFHRRFRCRRCVAAAHRHPRLGE